MPSYIIHKDGAYNIYSTISDGVYYSSALTLEQLEQWTREELGRVGIEDLPKRLERAHKTGCSGFGWTLNDCIDGNRAGEKEKQLSPKDFIGRYLTLPA